MSGKVKKIKLPMVLVCSSVLLASCASVGEVDATRRQLAELNQRSQERFTTLESRLSNERLLELVNQVDRMSQDIAKLRGDMEVLNYTLQTTQKRQNDLYNDLDLRLAPLEGKPAGGSGSITTDPSMSNGNPATATSPAPAVAPDPVQLEYSKALESLRARQFNQAIPALKNFIDSRSNAPQVADAQYWLGVAYTAERQWKNAIAAHKSFVDGHPNHAKVPEALRNIGNCYRELGDKAGMKTAWDSLLKRFPKSEAAAKVKQQLAAQNG
ncbi:tol-pal system protein YbgF [Aquaspirillum soli]|jgi:tol-pal system protein YbgF|nr:tetratricopeptide repeat protein [Aquaspirillum sp.]